MLWRLQQRGCTMRVFRTFCSPGINDHVLSKCQCDVAARAKLHSRAARAAAFSHTRCLLFSTS
jgi:hypothetical protein